jgi:CRP-like cAMP-binding protein
MARNAEVLEAIEQAVEGHAAFSELLTADDKQYLMHHGVVHSVPAGEVLCRQFQRDDRVFIIVLGEVEVTEEVEGRSVVLARLSRGELFGEISALFGIPRVSNVIVVKPSVLLEISGAKLDQLLIERPEVRNAILQRTQKRITETALRAVEPFRVLPEPALRLLIENSSLVSVPVGSDIVREGEAGDAFYIIIFGAARVSSQVKDETVNIALLRPGEFFGEWSLLTGSPRTATVTAVTQVDALRVNCGAFLDFIQQYPDVRDRIDRVAHNRHDVIMHTSEYPESARKLHNVLLTIEDAVRADETHLHH